ncbi:MAG: hypothetical protein RLZZ535_3025 [Cyanobacteriota bacterium]|jgi:hypothetical protein
MLNTHRKTVTVNAYKDLFTDLSEQDSEAINGGAESFTLKNEVNNYDMSYNLDGTSARLKPGYSIGWTAYSGGIVSFDKDARSGYQTSRKYNLSNGRIYAFRPNTSTSNQHDFDLYDIT